MTLLALFGLAIAVPLVFGSWRVAVAGLGLQALVVLAMTLLGGHHPDPAGAVVLVLDLGLVRGLLGPLLLARAFRRGGADLAGAELEVLPADLAHWVVGSGLVVLAASFAARVAPHDPARAARLGLAAAEVLLGFLVVVHHRAAPGQAIGMLMVENGVLLFEASLGFHVAPAVHLGLTATVAGLIGIVAWLAARPDASADHAPSTAVEGEVL